MELPPNKSTGKKTNGRQKINPNEKIKDNSKLNVTFSKRRSGLFKKAGELCVLCGSEVAVLVISPAGKVFGFGHKSIDEVIQRYLSGGDSSIESSDQIARNSSMNQLEKEYHVVVKALEEAKKKQIDALAEVKEAEKNGEFWWDQSIDEKEGEDLAAFVTAMKELRAKLVSRVEKLENSPPALMPLPQQTVVADPIQADLRMQFTVRDRKFAKSPALFPGSQQACTDPGMNLAKTELTEKTPPLGLTAAQIALGVPGQSWDCSASDFYYNYDYERDFY